MKNKPWNKGLTKETDNRLALCSKKISKSKKGKYSGKNNPFWGRTHSEEARAKMSKSHRGKKLSDEHKRKLSIASKNSSVETRRKISEALKGKTRSAEQKVHYSLAAKIRWSDSSYRKRMSKMSKDLWKNPSHKDEIRQRMLNGGALNARKANKNPSYPQLRMFNRVKEKFPDAEINYALKIRDGKWFELDVAIPSLRINLEYDGSYWHSNCKEKDAERDKIMLSKDWLPVRFDKHNIDCLDSFLEILSEGVLR